jgi:hypothetical protein
MLTERLADDIDQTEALTGLNLSHWR